MRGMDVDIDTVGHWQVWPNGETLSQGAAAFFYEEARAVLGQQAYFTCALSGGKTPQRFFQVIAERAESSPLDWTRILVFWTDERCVPRDAADSNYRSAEILLLSKVPLPRENIFRIAAEAMDPSLAAKQYEKTLRTAFSLAPGQRPVFDLIFLGMGTDGHIASLFPGSKALAIEHNLVDKVRLPQVKHSRITLTLPVLMAARKLAVLVSGPEKAETLAAVFQQKDAAQHFPIARLLAVVEKLYWFVDQEAAAKLS